MHVVRRGPQGNPMHIHVRVVPLTKCVINWLPVKQRAVYKLALVTVSVLQTSNPVYLCDLLVLPINLVLPCDCLISSC